MITLTKLGSHSLPLLEEDFDEEMDMHAVYMRPVVDLDLI